jgi:hypothetical protein
VKLLLFLKCLIGAGIHLLNLLRCFLAYANLCFITFDQYSFPFWHYLFYRLLIIMLHRKAVFRPFMSHRKAVFRSFFTTAVFVTLCRRIIYFFNHVVQKILLVPVYVLYYYNIYLLKLFWFKPCSSSIEQFTKSSYANYHLTS